MPGVRHGKEWQRFNNASVLLIAKRAATIAGGYRLPFVEHGQLTDMSGFERPDEKRLRVYTPSLRSQVIRSPTGLPASNDHRGELLHARDGIGRRKILAVQEIKQARIQNRFGFRVFIPARLSSLEVRGIDAEIAVAHFSSGQNAKILFDDLLDRYAGSGMIDLASGTNLRIKTLEKFLRVFAGFGKARCAGGLALRPSLLRVGIDPLGAAAVLLIRTLQRAAVDMAPRIDADGAVDGRENCLRVACLVSGSHVTNCTSFVHEPTS
jgi:hypothetical protein